MSQEPWSLLRLPPSPPPSHPSTPSWRSNTNSKNPDLQQTMTTMQPTTYTTTITSATAYPTTGTRTIISQCSSATITINSTDDAAALASACPTVSGSVLVSQNVAGYLDLSGIFEITGSVVCKDNPSLTGISLSEMISVNGIMLQNMSSLSTILFESLLAVYGNLQILGSTTLTIIELSDLTYVFGSLNISGGFSRYSLSDFVMATD